MHWKVKACAQGIFSSLPCGESLNYFCQRFLTRSLPNDDDKFIDLFSKARLHLQAIRRNFPKPIGEAIFYEFGAGWDLTTPLSFYCLGVNHQVLVDIRHLVKRFLVNDTIVKLQQHAAKLGLKRLPERLMDSRKNFEAQLRDYGIFYKAPCDARSTGMDACSVDCITSTHTLEHIPEADIGALLRECSRLLRKDGVLSFQIDYQDHYAYFDPNISVYNFLRYPEHRWRWYNPPLHYQNRLRHRDYLRICQEAGFKILAQDVTKGAGSDLEILRNLPVDNSFRLKYTEVELAIRNAHLVLKKSPAF